MPDKEVIAMKLRTLRGDKTQQFIADQISITRSAWANYEQGKRVPKDELKVKIAKYFNQSVQSIFFKK